MGDNTSLVRGLDPAQVEQNGVHHGKSLFAGWNDFATNLVEVTGETEVSPSAYAWVSQHANYNGFNVRVSGAYPNLEEWYFIQWMGPSCQQQAKICYVSGDAYACVVECNPQ